MPNAVRALSETGWKNLKTILGISALCLGAWALQSGLYGCRSQEDTQVTPEPRSPTHTQAAQPMNEQAPAQNAQGSMGSPNAQQGKPQLNPQDDPAKAKPPPRFFGGSKAAAIDWPEENNPPPQPQQQQQNAAPQAPVKPR